MFYLGYITLYVLQTKFETTVQLPITPTTDPLEITNDDLWPEETVFPKDGPAFIHGLQENNHQLTRKASDQNDKEINIERRFGPLVEIPEIEPQAYIDSYSLALGPRNQGTNELKYKTDFTQNFDVTYTATQKRIFEIGNENGDGEIIRRGQHALPLGNEQTTVTVGIYAFYLNKTQTYPRVPFLRSSDTQTRSTMHFMYSDAQTRSTMPLEYPDTQSRSTMPFIYSEAQTRSTMPFVYFDAQTRSTMPFQYLNAQTHSTMPFIYSRAQTRSTMPFKYLDAETRSTMPFQYLDAQTRSTMPFKYSDHQTRSTMPFKYSDAQTRSTMPFKYSDAQTRFTMPFKYSDHQTPSTMPFKYSGTQSRSTMPFTYSDAQTRSTVPFIYSDAQTRSRMPFTSSEKTITDYKVNTEIYSATERNIIRNGNQKGNGHFINVYNYMHNQHDGKDAKRLKQPLKHNLKARAFDGTHHSIRSQDQKYFDYEASETPIERFHATQKSESGFMKDEKFSRPPNRPGLDSHFNDDNKLLKSGLERFKEPLQKLASMKASFYNSENNPFKKEIELVNNEGDIFRELPSSTAKVNEYLRLKNAALFRSNVGRVSPKVGRLDNSDVTQTEWYPWIKTGAPIHNRASFMTYLPEIQTTASPIYPWILTKMFTALTTEGYRKLTSTPSFMNKYKANQMRRNPDNALRSRPETTERLSHVTQEKSQEIQLVSHRVEPVLENSQAAGIEEEESEPFSMFLAKLMKILSSKSLRDLKGLIRPFERSLTTLLDSGKLMKLGMTTGSFIAEVTTSLIAPMKEIQRHIFIMQVSLENRHRMLDDGFNAMLDELDNVYDVSEEEAMQRVLREATVYPNTSKTGEQIVQGFVEDVFLHPMNRIAGTAHGNVVFENIAKVANKYNTPYEPIARRNENQYQITKYNKNRGRVMNEKRKVIRSRSTKNQVRRRNKKKEKEAASIKSHLDDEEGEDESFSSDNTGVEIKIQINNKKPSKRNKRRILKKDTENKVYKRRPDEYDRELFATENIQIGNYGLTNGDLRKYAKYAKEHLSGRISDSKGTGQSKTKNDDREIIDSKVTEKSKVTLQFDCEPLPVIVSNKNDSNRQNYNNLTKSEMIMYCSNANNNN